MGRPSKLTVEAEFKRIRMKKIEEWETKYPAPTPPTTDEILEDIFHRRFTVPKKPCACERDDFSPLAYRYNIPGRDSFNLNRILSVKCIESFAKRAKEYKSKRDHFFKRVDAAENPLKHGVMYGKDDFVKNVKQYDMLRVI